MPSGFMLWDPNDRLVLWNVRVANYHLDPSVFREGQAFEDILVLPHKDRRNRFGKETADAWFSLSERRTPDGFTVKMVSDVPDLYESQTRLLESEERYRTMINLSPDAIYVHKQGIIAVCNEAAIELFGAQSADELIGRELLDLTHPDYREEARKRRSSVVEEGTRTLAMRQKRLRLDGSWFWAEVAAAAINW